MMFSALENTLAFRIPRRVSASPRFFLAAVICGCASAAFAAAPQPLDDAHVQFDIMLLQFDERLAANEVIEFSGQLLELHVSQDGRGPNVITGNEAVLRIGDEEWDLEELRREQKKGKRPDVTLITAPRILCDYGQSAIIAVGEKIHWLERDENGCLHVVTDEESFEGVHVSVQPERGEDGAVSVKRLRVTLGVLSSREEIEDVPLDVGRPVISSVGITASFDLAPEHVAVVPMPTWDAQVDPILVVIKAREVAAE